MTSTDLDIFNQLLYAGVFRGQHSTGVFGQRKGEKQVFSYKEALPSYAFMLQTEYTNITKGLTNYVVPPSWIVGHSRHATRGAVNARNAHPFTHGDITLVHNGTLLDQDLLPDSKRFEVDSENICHSINTIGAAETIQKLDGAFTLIWHDAKDNTLHIIRNDERPFHLARCGLDWFGASEEAMLMWILERSKSHKNRINDHFECKVGTEYIFDVSNSRMTLVQEVEHTLPVFTVTSRWGGYYSNSSLYQNQQTNKSSSSTRDIYGNKDDKPGVTSGDIRRRKAIEDQNKLAADRGLPYRRDGRVDIIPHEFHAYNNTDRGKMVGYIYDDKAQEYVEGDVHNVAKDEYLKALENPKVVYRGTIACISEVDSMIRLVLTSGLFVDATDKEPQSTTADFDDDIPFDAEDSFITKNGVEVTRKFWESHSHGDCGGCDKHIDWKDARKAVFAYQAYWHPECFEALSKTSEEEEDVPLGVCAICGEVKTDFEFDNEMSKLRGEDVCYICSKEIKDKVKNVTLSEGYIWTKAVDTTNPRRPEVAVRVDERMLSRMIVMVSSAKRSGDITLADVPNSYLEKRGGDTYAISVYGPKNAPKEVPAEKAETFPEKSTSLRKTVVSYDGQRTAEFTKALWTSIGFCAVCYKQIPWRDAETCSLNKENRVICNSDYCKGKH